MGGLISYSGISTKIRAMERWRISDAQFSQMAALESVPEAVRFLMEFPPYEEIFKGLEEKDLHRGMIEQQLNLTQYRDFAKLYKFANRKQRSFLGLYFMHYEIDILKTCLRNIVGNREQQQDLSLFNDFFNRHSKVDLERLAACRSIPEFIENMKESPYYGVLSALLAKGQATLPACETAMDMFYFKGMWKAKDKYLSGKERRVIESCFGTRMDMLNLQWIYRCKKYYKLSAGDIYAVIIPVSFHLTKADIRAMAEAESSEKVYALIRSTWYGRLDEVKEGEEQGLNALSRELVDRIYQMTGRREPYSIAALNSYLYFKEREIERIITTIEQIRYGVATT